MASRRMISRSLGISQKYAALIDTENGLADFCHALFPLLVANADDFGRLQGDAFTVKHTCFPISHHSIDDFENAILAMHRVGLLTRYRIGLHTYVQIANFRKHQPGLLRNANSLHPAPNAEAIDHLRRAGDDLLTIANSSQQLLTTASNPPTTASNSQQMRLKERRKEGTSTDQGISRSLVKVKKARTLTKAEKTRVKHLRAVGGSRSCPHKPRCQTWNACRDRALADARLERAAK